MSQIKIRQSPIQQAKTATGNPIWKISLNYSSIFSHHREAAGSTSTSLILIWYTHILSNTYKHPYQAIHNRVYAYIFPLIRPPASSLAAVTLVQVFRFSFRFLPFLPAAEAERLKARGRQGEEEQQGRQAGGQESRGREEVGLRGDICAYTRFTLVIDEHMCYNKVGR